MCGAHYADACAPFWIRQMVVEESRMVVEESRHRISHALIVSRRLLE